MAAHQTQSSTQTGNRKARQPRAFSRFQCVGPSCEDSCCIGWGVPVDRETYEKYQRVPDRRVNGRSLSELVEIRPSGASPNDHARLLLDNGVCSALDEGLCGIQKGLGEPYLPDLCSKYPRVYNALGETVERSLHLSCPEAARLVLTASDAMEFECGEAAGVRRPGSINYAVDDPRDSLYRVRLLLIELIRDRSVPMWRRIGAVGAAVDRLGGIEPGEAVAVLEDYLRDFRLGRLHGMAADAPPDSLFQLETVIEIVVARISGEYTPRGFLGCYRDFMLGLNWAPDSTIEDLARRYDFSRERYFLPFAGRHPHFFENYLSNFIFYSVFPYRSKLPDKKFAIETARESLRHAFLLLTMHYAILRTLLIGIAARYRDDFDLPIAVRLVQAYSKAFLHNASFETKAFEYLARTMPDPAAKAAQLVM